ncbi:MAG: aldehyde dehydrogenase family protein [Candidatus Aenigmarchaeota archaeon]|nr:aldehyde dehydrogenase family protein [Candidatus Aenigmarchaeota archaeon]
MSIFDSIRFVKDNKYIYKILINGKWLESSTKKTFEIKSPADGSLIAEAQKASKRDAGKTVKAAFNAKTKIANMDASERGKILDKMGNLLEEHKDEFINVICRESGKTIKLAQGEVHASIERLHYASDEAKEIRGEFIKGDIAGKRNSMGMVVRQPLGVLLAITPFNYPLFTGIAKIAPGIAVGNSIVVKPASADPICLLMFGRIMQEAGLPDGVLNIITGSSSEIGDYLCSHPQIDMISFTGSSEVGKHIASIAGMKKLHLELGGKAPAIVLEDCNLDIAVKEVATGSLKFSGQRCDSISRVLVVESIANNFVKGILKEVENWKFGDPRKPENVIGPLINEAAAKRVEELVSDAIKKGAKLLYGGKRYEHGYFEPTVLDFVNRDMKIAWEETFGPVITIIRVKDYEEAIELANESEYGLDACIFTKDIDKAFDAAQRIEAGSVHINAHPTHGLGMFPFGGDESSGVGREGIKYSIEDMSKVHVMVLHSHKE